MPLHLMFLTNPPYPPPVHHHDVLFLLHINNKNNNTIIQDYDALQNAKDNNGDCITYQKQRFQNNETYKSCAHIMPEAWNGQNDNILMYETQNLIEPSIGSGTFLRFTFYDTIYVTAD